MSSAGFSSGIVNGEIVIAGGTNWEGGAKRWLDGIWAFDPRRNTWRQAGVLDAPLGYAVAAQDERTLWFAGGSSGTSTHQKVWQMQRAGAAHAAFSLEAGCVYASGAMIGDTLYVVGGTDDQARLDRASRSCIAISLRTGAVQRLPDYPVPFAIGAAAAAGGRVYVFGGMRWDSGSNGVVNHASAFVYSPASNRWDRLPPMPAATRGLSAVPLDERNILLAGGYTNEFTTAAYRFDVESRRYTVVEPLPYAAGSVGLLVSDGWIYCIGGEDQMRHRTDAVFRIRKASMMPVSR